MRLLLNWVLSALAVWIMAQLVPGISVHGPVAALIAALAIGFINALMLEVASAVVPGFQVHGFIAAFIGAIVLSLVNLVLKGIVMPKENR